MQKSKGVESTINRLNAVSQSIGNRTRLSTTGYQLAMRRLNDKHLSDTQSEITLRRAEEYMAAAKKAFPTETLKNLAQLQQQINTFNGALVSPNEMTPKQLERALNDCRRNGFANCDMQALETGLHIKYVLGISNFKIFSNAKISHNYAVIDPCTDFPKGAIVDPWTGKGFQEMNIGTKFKLKHSENNCKVNHHMMAFINESGAKYM